MELTERECQICGAFFTTSNPRRIYCDSCSAHSTQKQREYAKAYRENQQRMYEPKIIEETCHQCGKKFKTIYKLLITASDNYGKNIFCTVECKEKFREEHTVCAWCGKSLNGNIRYNPNNFHPQYCSEECKEKARFDIARKNGWVRKCVHCGKEFIRKDPAYFCSQACYNIARKEGWKSPKQKEDPDRIFVDVVCTCAVCKKSVTLNVKQSELDRFTMDMVGPFATKIFTCSKKCKSIYLAHQKQKAAIQQQKKEKPTEPLCMTCKTSYKKCERLQSDFRILPKGAHYGSGEMAGKVVSCPKFKG